MKVITLPNFNPVLLDLGLIQIRWYSLAYIFGIVFGLWMLKIQNRKRNFMSKEAYDMILTWAVFSIIIGGRLGYVIFYNLPYFAYHPLEVFAIWQGGMSFHGGLIGMIVGMKFFCKKYHIRYFELTDILSFSAPIGIFLGRIANFINLELYGRVAKSGIGVIFPGTDGLPRHPSQLYEAASEGLLSFIILFSLYNLTSIKNYQGVTSGLFLCLYAICRLVVEQFRQPDEQIGFIFANVTMGQMLCMPLLAFGIVISLLCYLRKR